MSDYKLASIRIFSFNLPRAVAFYQETVGLDLAASNAQNGWALFTLGNSSLVLEHCDPKKPESNELVGRFIGASLAVPDISAVYESLISSGVVFTSPPKKQAWGGVLAHFKDPDGNTLTLIENAA